jgi:hypothetical protein
MLGDVAYVGFGSLADINLLPTSSRQQVPVY